MKILAWETTGFAGSVAALTDGQLLVKRELALETRSAQSLAPALRVLLAEVGWRPADVELVATAIGPGSFTGLRVGITTAKLFSYAVGCPLVGVNTLEAIAERAGSEFPAVSVAMDAQRHEVFAASFARSPDREGWRWTRPAVVLDAEEWLHGLEGQTAATGPALETLASRVPAGIPILPSDLWHPTGAAVGQLGWRLFQAGQRDDPMQMVPLYLRRTAAEEQWDRRAAK